MSGSLNDLQATQYLSAVAITISIWEHILNFDQEVSLVWRHPRSWSALQTIVMLNRYMGELSLLFIAYTLADFRGPISTSTCHAFVVLISIYGVLGSALSQFLLLLRAYSLWDNRKSVKYALIGGFVVCLTISVSFAIVVTKQAFEEISYSRLLNFCVVTSTSRRLPDYTIGVWGGMLLYDVYVFSILIANAMNQPRRHDSEILTNLRRDGALSFLAFTALRFAQFLPSVFGNVTIIFLTPPVAWSLDNILSFRLFLRVQEVQIEGQARQGWTKVTNEPSVFLLQTTIEMDHM